MSGARKKYGVCTAKVYADGQVEKGKSLPIRGEGEVDESIIKEKIVPLAAKKGIKLPIVIYSYWSKYPASRTSLDSIVDKRGVRFRPREPLRFSKSYDWLVDENGRIHGKKDFRTV
jgi:hypothetical protein